MQTVGDQELETLRLSETFESIQGEGALTGRWCTFIRFQGCTVGCSWCDTKYTWDFAGGEPRTLPELWALPRTRHLVFTGGEPVQQPRGPMLRLVEGFLERGHTIQVETSARFFAPWLRLVTWRTLSPKPPDYRIHPELLPLANELKYVVDEHFDPSAIPDHVPPECQVFLQPESNRPEMVEKALALLREHQTWRLSVQLHKLLDLP